MAPVEPEMIAFLLLIACEEGPYGVGPEVYDPPVPHVGDDWLFSTTRISRVDFTLSDEALEILRAERPLTDPRHEVRGEALLDGESAGEVGLRLRGHLGSFSGVDHKPKWKIDFNEFTGREFHGLKGLALNNAVQDPAMTREALAHAAFSRVGLPASRTGYVQLFVNGLDYGLYLILEDQDDVWLGRLAAEGLLGGDHGNFYDGSYIHVGWTPMMVDFAQGKDHLFELEEGVDIDHLDISQISEALGASQPAGLRTPELEALVNWEEVTRYLVMEQWIGSTDSYRLAPNNYRVYFDPGEGMKLVPWDVDLTFGTAAASDDRWTAARGGTLAVLCLRDLACRDLWAAGALDLADRLEEEDLPAFHEELIALIAEGAEGDPRSTHTPQDREEDRAWLQRWLSVASDDIRYTWR